MNFTEPDISSSYKKFPGFGEFFYNYVLKHKPKTIIEFGVRRGYSAICMAQALRELGEGHLYAYDNLKEAGLVQIIRINDNIEKYELQDWITFELKDFYTWIESPTPFDLLHIDIDNTGDVIKLLAEKLPGKHIIFEGGVSTRDRIGQTPMVGAAPYELLIPKFPGLSKLI